MNGTLEHLTLNLKNVPIVKIENGGKMRQWQLQHRFRKTQQIQESIETNETIWCSVLGNLMGDGGYSSGKTYYCNKNEDLIKRFEHNFNLLFKHIGINLTRRDCKDVMVLPCSSTILFDYLNEKLDVMIITEKRKESQINFLKSMFNDEGSVDKQGIISLVMKDQHMINTIATLLSKKN